MAFGWPHIMPIESGLCPSSQRIVYLKVINGLFLVVTPTRLERWSSSQVVFSLFIHFNYYALDRSI